MSSSTRSVKTFPPTHATKKKRNVFTCLWCLSRNGAEISLFSKCLLRHFLETSANGTILQFQYASHFGLLTAMNHHQWQLMEKDKIRINGGDSVTRVKEKNKNVVLDIDASLSPLFFLVGRFPGRLSSQQLSYTISELRLWKQTSSTTNYSAALARF